MVRAARFIAVLICWVPVAAMAEDGGNGPAGDEMKVMRQMLEQQSKQIDVLAQEIARLNMLLEGKAGGGAGAESPAPAPEPAATKGEVPRAIPLENQQAGEAKQTGGTAAADEGNAPGVVKGTPGGPVHIVAKGETLTAIAKRYKVTVPELLKVNKIADVRRLQIGQSVALPPNAKMPASPSPSAQPQ